MDNDNSSSHPSNKRSYRLTDDLARELDLTQGQIVRAVVISSLDDESGKVLLNLKGQRVVAQTNLDVDDYQPLIVKVQSTGRPIELKLFDQADASQELNDSEWSQFVEDLGIAPSDELLEIIPDLASEHVPLSQDVLEEAQEHIDELRSEDGSIDSKKVDAFTFLERNELPVSSELIDVLSSGRLSQDFLNWPGLPGEGAPLSDQNDVREVFRKTGIDYVNQIGRWPLRASETLHSKLLRKYEEEGPEEKKWMSVLSSILQLGLMNAKNKEETILPIPPPGKGIGASGTITIDHSDRDTNVKWTFDGVFTIGRKQKVGIELMVSSDLIEGLITCLDEELLETIQSLKERFGRSLGTSGRNVSISVEEKQPSVDDVSFEDTEPSLERLEGVNFTI